MPEIITLDETAPSLVFRDQRLTEESLVLVFDELALRLSERARAGAEHNESNDECNRAIHENDTNTSSRIIHQLGSFMI